MWRSTAMEHLTWLVLVLGMLASAQAVPYPYHQQVTTVSNEQPKEGSVQQIPVLPEEVKYLKRLDDSEQVDSSTPQTLLGGKIEEIVEDINDLSASNETDASHDSEPNVQRVVLTVDVKDWDRTDSSTATVHAQPPAREDQWGGWMYKAFSEGMMQFMVQSQELKCSRDSSLYRQQLQNLSLWATRMFDASALAPNGFVSGDTYQFGHFDECISIEAPEHQITGKYCLASIRYGPDPRLAPDYYGPPAPLRPEMQPSSSVWDQLKVTKDPRVVRRDVLHWAVCVPSSCGAEDIQASLNASLAPPLHRQGVVADISISKEDCYSIWEAPAFSTGYFIVMAFMYAMSFLCVAATLLDYATGDQVEINFSLKRYIKVFSAYANARKLVRSNPQADFKLVHCLKYLSMQCVILGHKEMYLFGKPIQNASFVESFYSNITSMLFLNGGGYIVDTFFVFSGFLTCHFLTKELEKRKNINLFLVVIGKVIKILPLYGFIIAFHAVVLPYLGTGPMWNALVWREALRCQKNWWANLLFINNYVNVEDMCMIQAWYLACDMHFFIVGIVLVYIKFKHPRLGNVLLAAAFAAAVAVPSYITYVNQYKGVVQLYHELQQDPVRNEHFRSMYVPSHVRFIPYIVGLISGYIYKYVDKKGLKWPPISLFFLIPFAISINLVTTFIAFVFYMEERPYSLLESVLYAGIHRVTWAIPLVFYIILDATQGIAKWGSVFRHPAWAPLGRLTYCAFLIHTIPMLYITGQTRTAPYHSRMLAAMTLLGEVALSFFFALLVNLVLESPLQRLQKMLLQKLMGPPKKTGLTQQNISQVADSKLTLTRGISKSSFAEEIDSKIFFTDENGSRLTLGEENGAYKS